MSNLDDKLKEIVADLPYPDTAVESIKRAISEELGIDDIIQDLVNLRVNMQNELMRLQVTESNKEGE